VHSRKTECILRRFEYVLDKRSLLENWCLVTEIHEQLPGKGYKPFHKKEGIRSAKYPERVNEFLHQFRNREVLFRKYQRNNIKFKNTLNNIIFIEDGIYALHGTHEVPAYDKVFNVQEMIAVTTDVPGLEYLVHGPSLDDRGIDISPGFPKIPRLRNEDLARVLWRAERDGAASRLIFFK